MDLPQPSGYEHHQAHHYQSPSPSFPVLLSPPILQSTAATTTYDRTCSGWPTKYQISLPPLSHVLLNTQSDSLAPIMSTHSPSPIEHKLPFVSTALTEADRKSGSGSCSGGLEPQTSSTSNTCVTSSNRHTIAHTAQTFSCMSLSSDRRQGYKSKAEIEEDELPRAKRPLLFVEDVKQPVISKPRWQDSERLVLLEAIVHDKALDDLSTFRWDWISLTVGKAKPACKEQWLCDVLPALLQKPSSSLE
ncbi:hypothetical protein PHYBLDRAFT_141831 [Phycomyces blakesleeanus NRRL 1555(-)]|uniref:Homeodomain-like DNA binding domain-containing transcription factor n=1 Tax=Phycomyces blakesleeanus (strain ATCC 8743b / DSM 1359 / FGSC 10004 / NBRC 33097 / NRRL 1555) TaxID=763407 RepID=A0A162UTZ7_PHYB8|nr:hypothetical protein PHYBLDRAFT_141831 [Phycomyces blakesleeanus NRRL 1555(-)]OAD77973.1 hypothetical protein PHYBLDRAFT_141831 [Phycomyces blakesleeanus NRRL 1555(-)]|eukprot:XP_018296013.1 hypothetical protein PHYBLDRAFT_141831 [Phycomyces blakesleeanus NRRL 1555(-)]